MGEGSVTLNGWQAATIANILVEEIGPLGTDVDAVTIELGGALGGSVLTIVAADPVLRRFELSPTGAHRQVA